MSRPYRYLRLFDLDKYREIEPIIKGIANRNIEAESVISLVKTAQDIIQTDDLKKYNEDDISHWDAELRKILDILEDNDITTWLEKLDRTKNIGIDITWLIISLICCPKFQFSPMNLEQEQLSGTTVDGTDFFGGMLVSNLELPELLETPIESLPIEFDEGGTSLSIFNQQQLVELGQAVNEDIYMLSQLDPELDTNFNETHSMTREECTEFYNHFNFLLSLTNVESSYTIAIDLF